MDGRRPSNYCRADVPEIIKMVVDHRIKISNFVLLICSFYCNKMRKTLHLTITLIILSIQLSGQQPLDTIYLKNGSVVYGTIRESSKNKYTIRTPDMFYFSFSADEVERFVSREKYKPDRGRPEGIGFNMESGLIIGSAEHAFPTLPSITPRITYTINTIHSVSVGIGFEVYDEPMLPLFAEYKINFSKKHFTPFCYVKGGGLFYLKSDEEDFYYSRDYKHGWTAGTGFGLSWPLGKYESYAQIGYRHSYMKYISDFEESYELTHIQNYNRLEISWGFKF